MSDVDTDPLADLRMRVKALEADLRATAVKVRRVEEIADALARQIGDLKARFGR